MSTLQSPEILSTVASAPCGFERVLELLASHHGIDSRNYKHGTLRRRATRRMEQLGFSEWPAYVAHLERHPDELVALYRDVLVTGNPVRFERELVATGKRLTTPDDPSQAIIEGVQRLLAETGLAPADLHSIVHGTTLALNALLTRTGAKVAIGERIKEVQKIFRPVFNAIDVSGEGSEFDILFRDGDRFTIGSLQGEVLATPGTILVDKTGTLTEGRLVLDSVEPVSHIAGWDAALGHFAADRDANATAKALGERFAAVASLELHAALAGRQCRRPLTGAGLVEAVGGVGVEISGPGEDVSDVGGSLVPHDVHVPDAEGLAFGEAEG